MAVERIIEVAGVPVRYGVIGEGPPLVLIHGLGGSWRWWRHNVAALSERHRLYLVDLPGFGAMRRCRGEFSLAGAPVWIRGLLDALGIDRASFVGHSMGGAIALALAAEYPGSVDRLVLAAAAVGLPYRRVRGSIGPLVAATARMRPRFLPELAWDALRAGPATVLRCAGQLLALDLDQAIRAVECPALLIWGGRDRLVPVEVGNRMEAGMRDVRLHVIPGAGHIVMWDAPEEFNRETLDFLGAA